MSEDKADTKEVAPEHHPCFLFHKWSKWEDIDEMEFGPSNKETVTKKALVQRKVCLNCNKKKFRQTTIWDAMN